MHVVLCQRLTWVFFVFLGGGVCNDFCGEISSIEIQNVRIYYKSIHAIKYFTNIHYCAADIEGCIKRTKYDIEWSRSDFSFGNLLRTLRDSNTWYGCKIYWEPIIKRFCSVLSAIVRKSIIIAGCVCGG